MASASGDRLISGKSRKAVQEFLANFSLREKMLENFDECLIRLARVADEVVPAFAEALDEKDDKKRILAAWYILYMAGPRPDLVQEVGLRERAERTLVGALESEEDVEGQCLFALTFLTLGVVPVPANGVLRKLLDHDDERIQVTAAAALIGCNCVETDDTTIGRGDAMAILMRTLRSDNETLVSIAARALIRQSLQTRLAVKELIEAFEKSEVMGKYHILQGLAEAGESASGATAAVTAAITDRNLPPAIRKQAAKTLAKIAPEKDAAASVLFTAMSSRDWQVVVGAAEGTIVLEKAGERVADKLAVLLSAADKDMRVAACLGLKAMEQQALGALPTLIERLGDESNLEVCGAMIEAVAAIGVAAIPSLIEVIQRGDARRMQWVALALVQMGGAAATQLAEALDKESDTGRRGLYVMLLRDMGWKAAPAVPVLGRILDETDDEELAFLATAAIFVCGQAGAPAAPSLVRCLMSRGDETASAAERSLKLIGSPALAALEEALKTAEGTAKRRIEAALKYFRPGDEPRFPHLERIGRDDLLKLFVLVGSVFERQGETSWRTVAAQVSDKITFKRANGWSFSKGDNRIAAAVKKLGELVNTTLTTHVDRKKGGLTPKGRKLLQEARSYLEQKYGTDLGMT
jgi:hypothetical protein